MLDANSATVVAAPASEEKKRAGLLKYSVAHRSRRQDLRAPDGVLASRADARILTAALRRAGTPRAIPPKFKEFLMNAVISYDNAFRGGLTWDTLQQTVPAAFADRPHIRTSPRYVFISTAELIEALREAGFEPTRAVQSRSRSNREGHARHMIRFRHIRESVTLVDAIPEIVLINSHDASSAYQLRAGLYRPVCTNGLLARIGDFGLIHVPHRGNVLANVVDAARRLLEGFSGLRTHIERMAETRLDEAQQFRFAEAALRIRYRNGQHLPYAAGRLLEARQAVDLGNDVWRTYNVVQQNVMAGGIVGRSTTGRLSRSRRIGAIGEDVRINTALWQLAMNLIRG